VSFARFKGSFPICTNQKLVVVEPEYWLATSRESSGENSIASAYKPTLGSTSLGFGCGHTTAHVTQVAKPAAVVSDSDRHIERRMAAL
jgi:hypothetical protein